MVSQCRALTDIKGDLLEKSVGKREQNHFNGGGGRGNSTSTNLRSRSEMFRGKNWRDNHRNIRSNVVNETQFNISNSEPSDEKLDS